MSIRWARAGWYVANAQHKLPVPSSLQTELSSSNTPVPRVPVVKVTPGLSHLSVDVLCVGAEFQNEAESYPTDIEISG